MRLPEQQDVANAASSKVQPGQGQDTAAIVAIYATFPSMEAAKVVARGLIEQQLAACVNLLPGVTAIYEWEGRVHEDCEVAAIIKTRAGLAEAAIAAVVAGHPYMNPAAIVIEVAGGSAAYLDWVRDMTQPGRPREPSA